MVRFHIMAWKKSKDPLFRGDSGQGVSSPTPTGSNSIVAHVLYIGGAGRSTPYQSTSESEEIAAHFARADGRVYRTSVGAAEVRGVGHIGQVELLRLLRGKGQGRAKWSSALEVMQARRYVELWAEHLFDYASVDASDIAAIVKALYQQ